MIYLISHHPILTSLLVERFGLLATECSAEFCLYRNSKITLIDLPEDISIASIAPEHVLNAERIFDISYAFWVGNEHQVWDIVLPNVFLTLHPDLHAATIDEENVDDFFSESLFLTQYDEQKDYDFGKFSLSVGGICVSGTEMISDDAELLEKIRIAYEPDSYDVGGFAHVEHLRAMSGREDIYVIQGLLTGEKSSNESIADTQKQTWENVVNITKFLVDNFLEWDGLMHIGI